MFHATTTGRHRPTAWATLFACGLAVAAVLYGSTGSTDNTAKRVLNPARTLDGGDPNTSRGRRPGLFKPSHDVPSFLRNHKSPLIPPFAPAPAIVVNSTAQSPGVTGDCTLGEAIIAANTDAPVDGCSAGSGTDTIILPAGTYTLSSVDNDDHGFVGATGLPGINTDVIIQGAGRATTIIERDSNAALPFRLMAIKDQNLGSLVLNDLTMRGGRAGLGANGGALFTRGRPATLNRVDFVDNRVGIAGNPSQSSGGAVSGGTVIANDCTFTNNGSDDQCCGGGAIFASDITVRTSTFTGNTAGGGGGAIFTPGRSGQVNISDSVFLNNSGTAEGGAMLSQGTVTIARSTFDGNSTTTTAGALSVAGNVNISDCVITNNHADSDIGGVSNYTFTNGANVLSINRTNISDNTSGRNAGGIQIHGTSATISNSTISTNHAGMNAGGLYDSSANLTLTNVTIEGNTAGNVNTAGDGGGMYCEDFIGTPATTLNNVTVTGNQASRVGAGVFHHSGDLSLKNTIIALNNNGDTFGADVYQKSVQLTSLGYNLIGIKDGENFSNAIGDQTGDGANPINPQLGPLQSNGGPTLTRALLSGSPAIDAANPAAPGSGGDSCAGTDQRGRRRPDGILNGPGRCDIGAFEVSGAQVCVTAPAGMVGWWPLDGTGADIQGDNHAVLFGNPSFSTGKVLQSLSFDSVDDYARVPAAAALDVGEGNGLTLDAWIKPADNVTARPVIEWNDGGTFEGVQLWISADFAGTGQGPGSLFVNLEDSEGVFHVISSAPGLLAANAWQHVALTYNNASGVAVIYLNGEVVAQQTVGTFTPRTSTDLYFGYRAAGVGAGQHFAGEMDEVEIFDHALTSTEIRSIYDADSAGKCKPAPSPTPTPAAIDITEQITVSDTPTELPSALIVVNEQINVVDTPVVLPPALIGVNEQINVMDTPAVLPSALIGVNEQINVMDTPAVLPSALIVVNEQINVMDTPAVLPPALIGVNEQINVVDAPRALPPALIGVNEQINVMETPAVSLSTLIRVDEQINVLDTPAVLPSAVISVNPVDDTAFFVRQQYLDFLNREPDETGLNFWRNEILACGQDASCIEVVRINTSAAFFLSIEFQTTGYEVYRLYKVAYGNLPGAPVPLHFSEFLPDTQEISRGVIVNQAGWQQVLENNQQAFTLEFVQRSRFTSTYPVTMTPAEFVDRLFAKAGVTPSATDRTTTINEFGAATDTSDAPSRARALRRVAENAAFAQQEFSKAFVLMEYFGYLRRDPNQPPDSDFAGYNFWLTKLNQFGGNFQHAEMVKAFITSIEYRRRFGP